MNYWLECVECALNEHAVLATPEQIKAIAQDIQGAHENYGMAFYQPESPYPREVKRLESELDKERSKISCRSCNGRGRITTLGPHHSSNSPCDRCNGEGKHLP